MTNPINNAVISSALFENMKTHKLVHSETGKVVKIHEMIHIGPQHFYDVKGLQILNDYRAGMEIHHEGFQMSKDPSVDDAQNSPLMKGYKRLADLLDFTIQKRPEHPFFRHDVSFHEMNFVDKMKMKGFLTLIGKTFTWLMNLVEKKDEEQKQETINKLRESFMEAFPKSEVSQMPLLLRWMESILLDKRNHFAVNKALETENNVSMVWGKAHAIGMIEILQQNGYSVVSS